MAVGLVDTSQAIPAADIVERFCWQCLNSAETAA